MAIAYQFNRTESQRLQKELKMREIALPILKNKESALRAEIRKYKAELAELEEDLERNTRACVSCMRLFAGFPRWVSIKRVRVTHRKIAGVRIPLLEGVEFDHKPFSLFVEHAFYPAAMDMIKKISAIRVAIVIARDRVAVIDRARRKTTQKVNLYEKVQIPELEGAILKIKRFIEDTDNLERSSQKIVKSRLTAAEAAAAAT